MISNKGWDVFFSSYYKAKVDIVSENGYIPDASGWNDNICDNLPNKITSVSNGELFVGSSKIGIIDGNNLVTGTRLMDSNASLTSWETDLNKLEDG